MSKNKNIYVCRGDAWKEGGSEGLFSIDNISSIKSPLNCLDATGRWEFRVYLKGGDYFICRTVARDTFYSDGKKAGEIEIKKLYKQFMKDIGMANVSK